MSGIVCDCWQGKEARQDQSVDVINTSLLFNVPRVGTYHVITSSEGGGGERDRHEKHEAGFTRRTKPKMRKKIESSIPLKKASPLAPSPLPPRRPFHLSSKRQIVAQAAGRREEAARAGGLEIWGGLGASLVRASPLLGGEPLFAEDEDTLPFLVESRCSLPLRPRRAT